MPRAVIFTSILLALFPAVSTAKECIPVLQTFLSRTGSSDLSLNDLFNTMMTEMVPLYLYLDVELSDSQAKELAEGAITAPTGGKEADFTVTGADSDTEFDLELGKKKLSTYYSSRTKKLTGYFEVRSVEGPYQGSMVAVLRPFKPTLKKCVRDTSGPHAYH